jgi:hypothetical protein
MPRHTASQHDWASLTLWDAMLIADRDYARPLDRDEVELVDAPESRQTTRRAVDIPCEVIGAGCDEPIAGRSRDLSEWGMWLDVPALPARAGEAIVVAFVPPGRTETMTVFGRVRHAEVARRGSRRISVGVELVGLEWEQRAVLAEAVRGIPPRLPRQSGVYVIARR